MKEMQKEKTSAIYTIILLKFTSSLPLAGTPNTVHYNQMPAVALKHFWFAIEKSGINPA
ncbi:MAG TPA: hypothetical protein VI979_01795 [archaeon]|nr:hypothetical protein [archaeon]